MRHSDFPIRLSSRLRVFGVSILPLVSLLLALALSSCGGIHECFGPTVLPPPALTVANGVVYAQGAENISALRADAGSVAWRSANGAFQLFPSAPVVADGLVIASTGFGALVAHHLSDGSLAWHSQAVSHLLPGSNQYLPSLTVADGIVYAAASPDTIAAWRVADGTFLWQSPSTNPTDDSGSYYTQMPEPVLAGNVVYFFGRDAVYAVSIADGSLLWSTPVLPAPGLPELYHYVSPVIADGRLFMVVADGSLYVLNAATGAVLWHSPDPDLAANPGSYQNPNYFAPPVVRGAVVYYASRLRIRAIDAATGHLIWQFPVYSCPPTSAPAVAEGVVYVTLQPSCLAPCTSKAAALSRRWTPAPARRGGSSAFR